MIFMLLSNNFFKACDKLMKSTINSGNTPVESMEGVDSIIDDPELRG
jgi:hypothetical protein